MGLRERPATKNYTRNNTLATATRGGRSDDVERAVSKLAVLGSGFKVVQVGGRRMVQSVPIELSQDHTQVLASCEDAGSTTVRAAQVKLGWDAKRVETALAFLLRNEFAWVDEQGGETAYWFVGMVDGACGGPEGG